MEENTWELESFTVERISWGDNKGNYRGNIRFINKEYETFYIKVSQEKSNEILKLITAELSQAAQEFQDKLINSIPKEQ